MTTKNFTAGTRVTMAAGLDDAVVGTVMPTPATWPDGTIAVCWDGNSPGVLCGGFTTVDLMLVDVTTA